MSENPTPDEVRASIVPKSDQLNVDDLCAGPITVMITKVRRGNKEQPIIVEIEGHRPYKPCKTMRRILIATFSDDPKQWIGQQMTLYCDPDVMFHGVKVGGIRISHLSGLDNPRTIQTTQSRGNRTEVTIRPIAKQSPEDQKFIAEATKELTAAASLEVLNGYGQTLKTKSKNVQDTLRPIYAKRLEALAPKGESP